jgi:2-hydroxy-3-keto-5-methylthiopentenyl-1-phosphate phosphatase
MKCAIVYDFDGTLARGDCAQYGLLPELGFPEPKIFWEEVKARTKEINGDEVTTYMGVLAEYANRIDSSLLSREKLSEFGKLIELFDGVASWFSRINEWAKNKNIDLEHYIISSGLEEMIRGTSISDQFRTIFACRYSYNDHGVASWPALAINYTAKTQYLFRINKGIHDCWDNAKINEFMPRKLRPVPFERMIYLGDGDTDIPAMKMVKNQGGYSIAVFDPKKWIEPATQVKIEKLISENRASFVVPADYSANTQLDVTIRGILRGFSLEEESAGLVGRVI